MLEAKPHWLASEARVGEYRVDTVALELLLRGAALSTCGEDEFVRLFREDVSAAASLARQFARVRLVWRPENLHLTNRFFDDLRAIQYRIKRNEGLSKDDLLVSRNPISLRKLRSQDATDLQTALRLAAKAIEDYLESYLPDTKRGGNYDWQTRCFIDELFELWCRCVRVDLYDEAQVFNKLLAAAWRDVQFPTQEKDGRCLEDWLAGRVRKHFHDGICNKRRERQELNLWLDNERIGVGFGCAESRGIHPAMGVADPPLGLAGVSHDSPGGA
jgi:hypothetical protein